MAARAWPPGALPISFEVEWVANSPYAMALACFPRAPARLLAAVKHARAAGLLKAQPHLMRPRGVHPS